MEEPNTTKPEPIIFEIDNNGISRGGKIFGSGISIITSKPAPRAGAK
jgi:hypothetical protein